MLRRTEISSTPPLLLTDQRTPERKYADWLVERFREAYPAYADLWANSGVNFQDAPKFSGGLVENITQAMGYPERGEFIVPLRSARLSRFRTEDGTLGFRVYCLDRASCDDEIDATLRSKPKIVENLQARLRESMEKAIFTAHLGETYDPERYKK